MEDISYTLNEQSRTADKVVLVVRGVNDASP